ncbi:MAG: hypothetical protein K5773_02180 [Pseudobutyrivibrio sp.]|nr:hypothetical protein [Pseudobutyrivibrio sp.]
MNIVFFVSDHGFGHIMRELPVISYMLRAGQNITVVCNDKHIELARQYLGDRPNYIKYHTDAGIVVIPGSIKIDPIKTAKNAEEMIEDYPNRINFAKKILSDYKIDKVVVDIVPWAIKAANEYGIESYFMASFTWLDQYGDYLSSEAHQIYERYFRLADNVLYYDLCNKPTRELLGDGIEVGFVAREFDEYKVQEIRKKHKRKIIYLSLGASNSGLDFDIDVSNLDYDFITTENFKVIGGNVEYLSIDTPDTQNYVKAADYCISKPGWTTTAEIMLAGTPVAMIERPDIPEDTMTIEMIEKRGAGISVGVNELKNMDKVIEKLEGFRHASTSYKNNYEKISRLIIGE